MGEEEHTFAILLHSKSRVKAAKAAGFSAPAKQHTDKACTLCHAAVSHHDEVEGASD